MHTRFDHVYFNLFKSIYILFQLFQVVARENETFIALFEQKTAQNFEKPAPQKLMVTLTYIATGDCQMYLFFFCFFFHIGKTRVNRKVSASSQYSKKYLKDYISESLVNENNTNRSFNILTETCNSYFCDTTKNEDFTTLQHISPNNSKSNSLCFYCFKYCRRKSKC